MSESAVRYHFDAFKYKLQVGYRISITGRIGLLLLLTACEEPFEPLAPNELAFSIYGHLDAAADTQWVRVMPIRASVETVSGPMPRGVDTVGRRANGIPPTG